jgi:hypothetical protein
MAWVPAVPPRKGLSVSISHPAEDTADGVVRYRVMVRFDPATVAFDEGSLQGCPVESDAVVARIVDSCNNILVIRRFSEFDNVFKNLASIKGTSPPLPPLPEKKLFGSKDPKFVESRRLAIETFARAVLEHRSLFERSEFLNLIGFNNLQLWYALSDPDDASEPSDETLMNVLSIDSEVLRSDAIQRASMSKSDAVRRSIGRLLTFALKKDAGVQAFVYEHARVALVSVAERAESDSTRMWIARAITAYARNSDTAFALVARGDVRDALVKVANRSASRQAQEACIDAVKAVSERSAGGKQLFLSPGAREALAYLLVRTQDVDLSRRLLDILLDLILALPAFKTIPPDLFDTSTVHGALGAARDRAEAAADASLHDSVSKAMVLCKCPPDVAAASPLSAAPPAVVASASAAKKPPVVESAVATTTLAEHEANVMAAVDDFLGDDDLDDLVADGARGGTAAVDDFLADDDDDGAELDGVARAPESPGPKISIDDFLDD